VLNLFFLVHVLCAYMHMHMDMVLKDPTFCACDIRYPRFPWLAHLPLPLPQSIYPSILSTPARFCVPHELCLIHLDRYRVRPSPFHPSRYVLSMGYRFSHYISSSSTPVNSMSGSWRFGSRSCHSIIWLRGMLLSAFHECMCAHIC